MPLTLLGLHAFHAYGVVEMGMRGAGQIEYLTKIAEPDVAVVVNAGSAHIELLGTTDAIARAKSEIWLGLREGGTVVRPFDDERLLHLAREHQPRARHVTFGEAEGADIRLVSYAPRDDGGDLVLDVFGETRELRLHLVGRHTAIDACCALAAAHATGASLDAILAGLGRAHPPSMRGEVVDVKGRKVIVDCYNANPASMTAALHTLAERAVGSLEHGRRGIAVLGDMLELGTYADAAHREIGALAAQLGLYVIAIGEHAKKVTYAARDTAMAVVADDPADAAAKALAATQPGDWILLKGARAAIRSAILEAV